MPKNQEVPAAITEQEKPEVSAPPIVETEPLTETSEEVNETIPETIQPAPPIVSSAKPELNPKLSMEDRIVAFLDGRRGAFVKVNDFLKSLYGIPKPGETPAFTNQQNMKILRRSLQKLQSDGRIVFANNSFERLGTHYYDTNDVDQKTKYHNIATIPIEAKIPQ